MLIVDIILRIFNIRIGENYMMNLDDKSLPEKLSDDIISFILKENLEPAE